MACPWLATSAKLVFFPRGLKKKSGSEVHAHGLPHLPNSCFLLEALTQIQVAKWHAIGLPPANFVLFPWRSYKEVAFTWLVTCLNQGLSWMVCPIRQVLSKRQVAKWLAPGLSHLPNYCFPLGVLT